MFDYFDKVPRSSVLRGSADISSRFRTSSGYSGCRHANANAKRTSACSIAVATPKAEPSTIEGLRESATPKSSLPRSPKRNATPLGCFLAEDGRDSDVAIMPAQFRLSREIYVPQLENGALQYIMMEIIATSDADSGWAVKDQPSQVFPTATGPSVVSSAAVDGLDSQKYSKTGFGLHGDGIGWAVRSSNFE
ncbi:hypothetical protein G7Y89_g2247 [Cudoniella acicularis]|uniref:Uncharacterized protein n=1 Tax=Cudoniella acicularis TaxID=354080 RepID=A0A8H4RTS4_9HELO|nr:hypothetical protein G7Y89_g2247 [Cudoniella acicularis]